MIALRYKWRMGGVAWLIHRLSGIGLTLYIFAHLYVLSNIRDPERFAALMEIAQSTPVKILEVGLLGMVVAHALNGLRVTMLEWGVSTKLQKPLFYAAAAGGLVITLIGGVTFLGGAH